MIKSFYCDYKGLEVLIEFSIAAERDEDQYLFDLDEIISVFDENSAEEAEYDMNEIEDIICEWLDKPKNYNKLVKELENSEY